MCRLYTFRSNHPRKVECELIEAQNSLLAQSKEDSRGESNRDGWGLGTYHDGAPQVVRQPLAATESAEFRREAGEVHTNNVVAHIRRATVGEPKKENTHPFTFHTSIMAHNGTVGAFRNIRHKVLEEMVEHHRKGVLGSTDSEHFFHLYLSYREQYPDDALTDSLRRTINEFVRLSRSVDASAEVALNIILTNGGHTIGSRLGRTLYTIQREEVHACQVCSGAIHVEGGAPDRYRAVVVASEVITTDESWKEVPEGSVWHIDPDLKLQIAPL